MDAQSSEASETPPSRIAINHNETMLGGSLAIGQAYTLSDLLTSIQAFFSPKPTSGGCDEWGCGGNHNETMLSSSFAVDEAYSVTDSLSDLVRSIQSFFSRPGGGRCDEWLCGGNHNETMLETQLLIHPPGTSRSAGAPALSVGASYKHAAPPEQRPTLKLYVDRVAIL